MLSAIQAKTVCSLQEASENGCTSVTCSSDGTVFAGDGQGNVWAIGADSSGAEQHGAIASCGLGKSVQCLQCNGARMVVATDQGRILKLQWQDAMWTQTSEVCRICIIQPAFVAHRAKIVRVPSSRSCVQRLLSCAVGGLAWSNMVRAIALCPLVPPNT